MDENDFKLKLVEEISNCDEILAGKHLEKEGSFYPIGRLASITICKKQTILSEPKKDRKCNCNV